MHHHYHRSGANGMDDDWDLLFGEDDETVDKVKESNRNNSRRIICSSTNSIVSTDDSKTTSDQRTQGVIHPVKQSHGALSSMVVMDLCMKREQKLRLEGNIMEANALSAVGFVVMNLMSKVVELLQSNGCINVGSLMLEAVKTLMNKGSDGWESLILCSDSIHALIDEVWIRNAKAVDMEQMEIENKSEKNLDKEELLTKLANGRKKRKLEAVLARKQKEADEMRKRRHAMQQDEANTVFSLPVTDQTKNNMETSDEGKNAILIMAANKYKIRREERRKQIQRTFQICEQREALSQSSVLNLSNTSPQVTPMLPDDRGLTGPINAEDLMEGCEESDSNNSIILPSFPVKEVDNRCFSQQQSNSLMSSTGELTKNHMSNHIKNDFPAVKETKYPTPPHSFPKHAAVSSHPSTAYKILSPSSSQLDTNSTGIASPIKSNQSAQKYDNLSFVKIRKGKVDRKLNKSVIGKVQPKKKNVVFVDENEYFIIEMSSDPSSTKDAIDVITFRDYRKKYPRGSAVMPEVSDQNISSKSLHERVHIRACKDEKRTKTEKLSPREYDFFLESTVPRPIGGVNARSFCESCEFTRADIRNWLIVGSRFDYLNASVLDVKKNGCPKTHISRANYPPVHFRILSDALTRISSKVGGLKIFLAVGEDWIVRKSMVPDQFTAFIRKFAHVLHELYVKQYTFEQTRKGDFTDDLEKLKSHYAYVEMPSIILFTIPRRNDSDAEMKCEFYNTAIRELIRNWDVTGKSLCYHNATKQCIELKLIDWRQICINENANSNNSMITVLMKHLMEEWGICMTPKNRS